MIQPVDLQDFLLTFFVSAGIILSGACYALLFAWGRLRHNPRFLRWALLGSAGLCSSGGLHTDFDAYRPFRRRMVHAGPSDAGWLFRRATHHLSPVSRHP